MARSKRLNSILRFAETDERHAAQSLAESGRAVQECQGKLEDMRRYRHEYAQRLQTGDAMDAGEIQEWNGPPCSFDGIERPIMLTPFKSQRSGTNHEQA